jgi:cyclic pyranopterin phosphate synthase
MPEEGIEFVPHDAILTYEEILHIVRLSIDEGIRKVRLTGGEPLVRKGFIGFLRRLCEMRDLREITLTTNGVLLKEYATDLMDCGICRINISLDTLRPDRFQRIAGRDYFDKVWEGIEEALRLGFDPIKLNVVVIKGLNDDEILDFGRLTLEKPYHVRFIEFMPIGMQNGWSPEKFITADQIRERIGVLGRLRPVASHRFDGPARRFMLEGGKGEIGFIGALSNHFCESCNRLRLTSEGHLRSCLFSDQEMDIKGPLREGRGDEWIRNLIRTAMKNKPENHGFKRQSPRKCIRYMSSIGG